MIPELGDITPIVGNEHWEVWLFLVKIGHARWTWPEWVAMWRKPMDNFWIHYNYGRYD